MKNCIYFFAVILMLGVTFSCTKTNAVQDTTSLTVVNAVVGSYPLITNFSLNNNKNSTSTFMWFNSALQINYASSQQIGSYVGLTTLSLVQTSDTASSLYTGTFDLKMGSVYSLFIMGDTSNVDTLFTSDSPPYHPTYDSSIGIRFVNLSKGSNPVSVDMANTPTIPLVSSLPYKTITSFTNYLATSSTLSSYTFEFRDIASGNILATYTMGGINNGAGNNTNNNPWRYKNFTVTLIGSPLGIGGSSQNVLLVNNY